MEISDDGRLIMRFKDGDLSAFEELVVKYQDRIYNLCRYMLRNVHDAEDAAQDVFFKAYRNLKDFKPEASFYTWLYRISVNTCLDYHRKSASAQFFHQSQYQEATSLPDQSSSDTTPEKLHELREMKKTLELALAKTTREVEDDHYFEGN